MQESRFCAEHRFETFESIPKKTLVKITQCLLPLQEKDSNI